MTSTPMRRAAALLISLGIVAAACGDDAEDAVDQATDQVEETADDAADATDDAMDEAEDAADDAMDEGDTPATVVDIATSNDDFSTLVAALTEADLVTTLQGDGPFTVFAPTNEAFDALIAELGTTPEELLARDDLADILTYHVVPGQILAEDAIAADGTEITTVNGVPLAVSVVDGNVMVDDATVTTADLLAGNGVVHVIDAVVLPGT